MSSAGGPIFIGGLAGSGKTQLRIALDAHPQLSMTRRTYLWRRFYGRFGDIGDLANFERCLTSLLADRGAQRLGPEPARIRREFHDGPATYARLFGLLHQHHAERNGSQRWGDQLGLVERYADAIFDSFPDARMVHMVRDPSSCVNRRPHARLRGRAAVGWETGRWMHSARLATRNTRRYPGRYQVVRYEHLAARPGEALREICAFLDVPVLPAMEAALAGVRFDPPATRPAADGTPSAGHADTFIGRYARLELQALGYPVRRPTLTVREHLAFMLLDWPLERAGMAAWTVRSDRSTPAGRHAT